MATKNQTAAATAAAETAATATATAPATAPAAAAPVTLLAKLQAQAPAVATNAQLAALVQQITGAQYQAVSNGIAAPTRGNACISVWVAFCNYLIANQHVPTLAQLAPSLQGVNPTTQSVQFFKVRKYFGL